MQLEHKPKPADRVPLKTKIAWGAGGLADNYLMNTLGTLVNPIYNIALKLDPMLVGLAMMIPRFMDALFDPWIGNVSDNTRSRWGRRRPYIIGGAICGAILLPLLWMPPGRTESALFWYLLLMGIVFSLVYSVFVVPYTALGYEITRNYDERTKVQAWRSFIGLIGGATVPWLYKLSLWLGKTFDSDEVTGAKWVCIGLGVVIIVAGLSPALMCKEDPRNQAQETISLTQAIRCTLTNRPFMRLLIAYIIIITGLFTAGTLGLYVMIYTLGAGSKEFAAEVGGYTGTAMAIAAYASVPLSTFIASRFGKREAMLCGLAIGLLSILLQWFTLSVRWHTLPTWWQPQILTGLIWGLGIQGCWIMVAAMTADVCDEDELKTGLRREGVYGAVTSFALKAALAITSGLGGLVLVISGYHAGTEPGPQVIFTMRALYVGLQALGLIAGIALLWHYPITRERAEQTRRLLDERHANHPHPAA